MHNSEAPNALRLLVEREKKTTKADTVALQQLADDIFDIHLWTLSAEIVNHLHLASAKKLLITW